MAKEVSEWITVNGRHIPVFSGESKEDAFNRSMAKDAEDKKQREIAKNKEVADKLNGKSASKNEKDPKTGLYKSTKEKIDAYTSKELDDAIEKNQAYIDRADKNGAKDTKEFHEGIQKYMLARKEELAKQGTQDKMRDAIKQTHTLNDALKNNSQLREEVMDFSRQNSKGDNSYVKGSIRLSDKPYSDSEKKQFEKDFGSYMKQNFPNLNYSHSVGVRKDGTWLNIKNRNK